MSKGFSMGVAAYFTSAFLLIVTAFVIFRIIVRRDYRREGRLTITSSILQVLFWGLFMSFPYIYNPAAWVRFWSPEVPVGGLARGAGRVSIVLGLVSVFGTMIWFGLRRTIGLQVNELLQRGPYRITRNPQLVGSGFLVLGTILLWPSWYALGWALLFGVAGHLMVMTEEEHLQARFGGAFLRYCEQVPRYLGF